MFRSFQAIFLNGQVVLRLLFAFMVPYLFFSGLMGVTAEVINENLGQVNDKPTLGVVKKGNIPLELLSTLKQATHMIPTTEEQLLVLLDKDSIDIGLVFPTSFEQDSSQSWKIKMYYNAVQNTGNTQDVLDIVGAYEENMVVERVQKLGLDHLVVNPIEVEKIDMFSPLRMLGKIMKQVKGALSNILNILMVLLVFWLLRNLVLRAVFIAPKHFVFNLSCLFVVTLVAMLLVFLGFQMGFHTEEGGIIQSLILNIQQLLVWNKISSSFWLWLPTWGFVIGLMGCIAAWSKTQLDAYVRTFWMVVFLHVIAVFGVLSTSEMGILKACVPVLNVFGIGQLAMKGDLDSSIYWTAVAASSIGAVLITVLWYKLSCRKG